MTNSANDESMTASSVAVDEQLAVLDNTKVAVAQFAAIASGKGGDENPVKDLSLLQSTLFTLQHQQVVQMQLIQKLQSQLETASKKTKLKKSSPTTKAIDSDKKAENSNSLNRTTSLPLPLPIPAAEKESVPIR